jgi:hypothetical protein
LAKVFLEYLVAGHRMHHRLHIGARAILSYLSGSRCFRRKPPGSSQDGEAARSFPQDALTPWTSLRDTDRDAQSDVPLALLPEPSIACALRKPTTKKMILASLLVDHIGRITPEQRELSYGLSRSFVEGTSASATGCRQPWR